jgi:probable rRNA maturation factor
MRVAVRLDHEKSPVRVTRDELSDIRKCVNRCLRSRAIRKAGGPVAALLRADDSVEVCVALVSDQDIRALNLQYRGIDADTDVLSFWSDIGTGEIERLRECGDVLPLGDIVISVDSAAEQAERFGHPFRRELAYLVVHGVLHLLGYDHQNEAGRAAMRSAEEEVLSALGIRREQDDPGG